MSIFRNLLIASALAIPCSMSALAQDNSQFEVFLGFSARINSDERTDTDGFAVAFESKVWGPLGVVGEIGNTDGEFGNKYTFMGGPRVRHRKSERFSPFGHVLFGAVNAPPFQSTDIDNNSDTMFGMIFGGGVDIIVNNRISIRPIQFDIVATRGRSTHASEWIEDERFSAGIVLKFGS